MDSPRQMPMAKKTVRTTFLPFPARFANMQPSAVCVQNSLGMLRLASLTPGSPTASRANAGHFQTMTGHAKTVV